MVYRNIRACWGIVMRTVGLSAYSRASASTRNIFTFQDSVCGFRRQRQEVSGHIFQTVFKRFLPPRWEGPCLVLSFSCTFPPTHTRQPVTADCWLLCLHFTATAPVPKKEGSCHPRCLDPQWSYNAGRPDDLSTFGPAHL